MRASDSCWGALEISSEWLPPSDTVLCSGTALSGLTLGTSFVGQYVYWQAEFNSSGLDGINVASGSGEAPVVIPDWVLTNTTIIDQYITIYLYEQSD